MSASTGETDVRELVDLLEISAVGTAESMLVNQGPYVPPTVHLISPLPQAPYVGYVVCRPYSPGDDAATAVAAMGALPAVMRAERLVLCWEHHDLCTALRLAGRPGRAVVMVDAGRSTHEVRWHPFAIRLGPPSDSGAPTVVPGWEVSRREPGGWLPAPVSALLSRWRAGGDPQRLREVYEAMQQAGYTVRWVDGAP